MLSKVLKKEMTKKKKEKQKRDVFGELEGHTQGEKIVPYQFCIACDPQKAKTV